MEETLQRRTAFFITGRFGDTYLKPLGKGMLPAVFARYGDLASLRHDFPLVLSEGGGRSAPLTSLSRLVDDVAATLGEIPEFDRIVRDAYAIEREIRRAPVETGELEEAWDRAVGKLLAERGEEVLDSSRRLRSGFPRGARIAYGDEKLSAKAVRHLWKVASAERASEFQHTSGRLLLKLRDILKAEWIVSEGGRAPAVLKAGIGSGFADGFDFEAMSRILVESKPFSALSEKRRERIKSLIETLEGQRFYSFDAGNAAYDFEFGSCGEAVEAYSDRHAEAVSLVKALRVAKLEVAGEYREDVHDRIFEGFGEGGLSAGDLALLPDYLVVLDESSLDGTETGRLLDLLRSGLPVKILVVANDVVSPPSFAEGHSAVINGTSHLVDAAVGFSDVFVLRIAASQFASESDALERCLGYESASLIVVYSGAGRVAASVPVYLAAAAGVESRAFTFLEYDPSGESERSSRLRLGANPFPSEDWVSHEIIYEDEEVQARKIPVAFTPAELMALDEKFADRFAVLPEKDPADGLIPLDEALDADWKGFPDAIPFIYLVDSNNRLRVAITDYRTLLEVRRCLDVWRALRESAGAQRVFETVTEEVPAAEATDLQEEAAVSSEPSALAAAGRDPDESFIDTERCTSCNECTQINDKMFAYNENKQAYIKDPDAGTFRQLVEAAESCQVGIIHPGRPRNPKEPGLEDLLRRAGEFT